MSVDSLKMDTVLNIIMWCHIEQDFPVSESQIWYWQYHSCDQRKKV